ncbi:spindle pole body formation-associated protein-domain-containing protein [Talaromyces proteolyticus]|uniref:Spindle pole body formation-associated protein-domain-containing protein n=1 Tax=Talaromyces proteolyticus TaxID=1131652 RepID=A0AAD4PZF1_9EURO|nr:spindle pole body formation-associated protein-domain-containing protein [Talaromyces proteolyticus]KAH8702545.1 spindle pole body formation-associated protein-domain-containing protein [Talaromyces proteolyticus]
MLGWITGQNEEEKQSTDNSRIAEPPQTPAPVFAIRAFKSALFGTPAGEDDTVGQAAFSERQADSIRPKNNPISQIPEWPKMPEKQNSNSANQLSQSPTKSILVTPGTLASRRKTVSFGSTVHHDDLRNSQDQKTIPSAPGSVTNQWMSAQATMNSKPRSKLTQSLLDAREKPTENLPRHISPARSEKLPTANQNQNTMSVENVGQNDVTINLDDPQSQSGQYWKSEFENYRKRTNLEIRKLIQYRSVARSYARKKDAETMRLTEKLRKEEEKFAEMERQVTGLASSMVSKGADVDKEELVQELTRQTALVVQYKHKVDTLRNALQRHGVVGGRDDETDADESVKEDKKEIRRLKHALDQANKRLEEKNHDDELGKVRNLAKSSEAKVSKLEKENAELKKGISRLMEASKDYEERRVEREAKLKQRAMKMELRNQELKGRLNQYRDTFQQETKMYQEEIKFLKTKIPAVEQLQRPDRLEDTYQKLPEAYAGIEIQDFGNHCVQTYSRHPQEMLQMKNG